MFNYIVKLNGQIKAGFDELGDSIEWAKEVVRPVNSEVWILLGDAYYPVWNNSIGFMTTTQIISNMGA